MKKMLAEYDSYVGEVKTYEIILQNSEDVCKVNWSVCHVAVYVCRDALEKANEKISHDGGFVKNLGRVGT